MYVWMHVFGTNIYVWMHVFGTNIYVCMDARFRHEHICMYARFWNKHTNIRMMYASTQQVDGCTYKCLAHLFAFDHTFAHHHVKCLFASVWHSSIDPSINILACLLACLRFLLVLTRLSCFYISGLAKYTCMQVFMHTHTFVQAELFMQVLMHAALHTHTHTLRYHTNTHTHRNGHTTPIAPHPVRSVKLSGVGPG